MTFSARCRTRAHRAILFETEMSEGLRCTADGCSVEVFCPAVTGQGTLSGSPAVFLARRLLSAYSMVESDRSCSRAHRCLYLGILSGKAIREQ